MSAPQNDPVVTAIIHATMYALGQGDRYTAARRKTVANAFYSALPLLAEIRAKYLEALAGMAPQAKAVVESVAAAGEQIAKGWPKVAPQPGELVELGPDEISARALPPPFHFEPGEWMDSYDAYRTPGRDGEHYTVKVGGNNYMFPRDRFLHLRNLVNAVVVPPQPEGGE